MENRRRISGQAWRALAVGVVLVLAGCGMIAWGWPEETRAQSTVLQLSGVMFALAVAVAIWHMVGERNLMRHPTPRFKVVRWVTVVGVALGAACYVAAFALREFTLAPLGQFFIWIGLGAMFAFLAAGSIRRELTERVSWSEVDGEDQDLATLTRVAALEPEARRAAD